LEVLALRDTKFAAASKRIRTFIAPTHIAAVALAATGGLLAEMLFRR
jgi:hypothetical protein